jgi:ABC-type Fe3+/spermidine/putrescine transport system ATPase subunit
LRGLEDRFPRQLSGGQQQRVAVARAIVIRPSVLLFDEPLSNLDARLREEMRGELRRLQQRLEIATIFVTHDQDEALSMATRVAVMHDGRIEQIGTPEEIYNRPRTHFVATFIGACNFLHGRVVEAGERSVRLAAEGLVLTAVPSAGGAAPGATGTLSVRPENARLLGPDESAPAGANVVSGVVDDVTYLGAARHYRVSLNGGPQFLVYQQGTLSRTWVRGDRVLVAWDPETASFYPDGTRG